MGPNESKEGIRSCLCCCSSCIGITSEERSYSFLLSAVFALKSAVESNSDILEQGGKMMLRREDSTHILLSIRRKSEP